MLARQVTCMCARYWPTAALARRSTRPAGRLVTGQAWPCSPVWTMASCIARRRRGRQAGACTAASRVASRCAARPRPTRARLAGGVAAPPVIVSCRPPLSRSRVASSRSQARARSGDGSLVPSRAVLASTGGSPPPTAVCKTNVHAAVATRARLASYCPGPRARGRGGARAVASGASLT